MKNHLNMLSKLASFDLKCSKMHWRLGLRPRPRWGSLRRSPRPPNHKRQRTFGARHFLFRVHFYISIPLLGPSLMEFLDPPLAFTVIKLKGNWFSNDDFYEMCRSHKVIEVEPTGLCSIFWQTIMVCCDWLKYECDAAFRIFTNNDINPNTKGPSIYDVHTKEGWRSGSGGHMWMGEGVSSIIHVNVYNEIVTAAAIVITNLCSGREPPQEIYQ